MSGNFNHLKQKAEQFLINQGIEKSANFDADVDYLVEEFSNQYHKLEIENRHWREMNQHLYTEAPNAILTLNRAGTIIEWNLAAIRLFNFKPEEFNHHSIFELLAEESELYFQNKLEELFQSSRLTDGELRLKSANGALRYVRLNAFCFFDPQRQEPLCHCTLLEISPNEELKASKQLIEIERDKYKQAVTDLNKSQSIAKIGIWKWYVQENRLDWSDEMFRIFGIDKQSFSGNLSDIMNSCIHPEDMSRVEEINRIIAETGQKITIEYRINLTDGSVKYIRAESGEMFRDENNHVFLSTGIVQDITERKLAELELMQMSEKLREQTEVLNYAHVLIRDLDNHIVYWNKGMENLYGWTREEALGKATHTFFQTIFPEPFGQYQQTLLEKGVWEGELLHSTKSGAKITVASHHALYRDAQGKPSLILEVNNDISALKQAEEQLRENERSLRTKNEEYAALNEEYAAVNEEYLSANEELKQTVDELYLAKEKTEESEARYRLIAENTADVIWVLNPSTNKFTYISPSVEKLRGYTPEEVMAQPVHEALTPESLKVVSESLSVTLPKFREQGRGTMSFLNEIDQPCKDGSIVNTEVTTTYVFNKNGEVEIIGVSRDISERKRAEEKIKETSDFLDAIFKYSSVAKSIQRISDKALIDINQSAEKLFGVERSQIVGNPTFDLIKWALPEQREKAFQLFNKQGYLYDYELFCLDREGKPRVLSIYTRILELNHQKYTLNEYLDITDRKNSELQLRENERDLIIKNEEYAALNEEYVSANEELRQTNEELFHSKEILEKSERNFATAFYSNPVPQSVTNVDTGEILAVNDVYCELFGYSREELTGSTTSQLRLWEKEGERMLAMERFLAQGHLRMLETTIRTQKGEILNVLVSIESIVWKEQTCAISTLLNITDRQKAIEALQQSQENFSRAFMSNASALAITSYSEGRFMEMNPAYCSIVGYAREELIDKRISDLNIYIDITDRQKALDLLKQEGSSSSIELNIRNKAGEIRHIMASQVIITYSNEKTILTTIVDITGRKLAEEKLKQREAELQVKNEEYISVIEELRQTNEELLLAKLKIEESEYRYHSILNNMLEGCQILEFDWNYLYINDAAEKHNQRPKDELLGKKYTDMWPGIENTEVFERIKSCLTERISHKFENEFVFPNGSLGYFELSIQPVAEGVFILSVDISERKKAELEVRHKNEEYAALNEELRFSNQEIFAMKSRIEEAFEKLKRANADLNKAQQVAKIGSWKWNLTENLLEWSDEMFEIFEIDKENFTGSLAEVMVTRIHPEDIEKVEYANRMVLEKGIPVPTEYRLLTGNGFIKTVWAEAGELIKDEEGRPHAISGIVQDITERKHIQDKLSASEERYRRLVENFPDGTVTLYDRDFRLKFVAGSDLAKYNSTPEDFLGKTFRELTPDEAYEKAMPVLEAAFNGQTGHYETSYWENRYYQVSVTPLRKADGSVDEILVLSQNISERYRPNKWPVKKKTSSGFCLKMLPNPCSFNCIPGLPT